MEFVQIPAGEFRMGCNAVPAVETINPDSECYDPQNVKGWSDSSPERLVTIPDDFQIAKYEVTQAEWESVMGANPSHFRGPDLPVDSVSWIEAEAFLKKLNAMNTGYNYRLPNEAEWEYAARAGYTNSKASSGSLEFLRTDAHGHPTPVLLANYSETIPTGRTLDNIAWYAGNSGGQTHPVGLKEPNAWGLYDMLGNVQEFVVEYSFPDQRKQPPSVRLVRGGSWAAGAAGTRVWPRHMVQFFPSVDSLTGIRVIREPRLPERLVF